MRTSYNIKHQSYHQNLKHFVFNNKRIQTCMDYGQQQNDQSKDLKLSTAPQYITPKQHSQINIRQSQISPQLQMKIKMQMKNLSHEESEDDGPPQTSSLLQRARHIHNRNLKYSFVKDWEQKGQLAHYRMKKKNKKSSLFKSLCDPQNLLIEEKFLSHQKNNQSQSFHNKVQTLDDQQDYTMLTSIVESSYTQKINFNSFLKTPLQIMYPSNKPKTFHQKVLSPKKVELNQEDLIGLESMRKNRPKVSQENSRSGKRYRSQQFVLDTSNMDSQLRSYLINQKIGTPLRTVKYLKRYERSINKDYSNSNSNIQQNSQRRQKSTETSQYVESFKTQTQNERLIESSAEKLRKRIMEVKLNPYIIEKTNFRLQNLNQKEWQNICDQINL